ncbi:MAG TPA: PqqD family protein [Chloroflexota bacterium]|nr:PqqD family protein [Chloroflexota bacterium]
MLSPQSIPRRKPGILTSQVDGSLVLLDAKGGNYFALDDVGCRIWELCDGTKTIREVALTLSEEYSAQMNEIEADIVELLGEMADENLVEPVGQSHTTGANSASPSPWESSC